MQQRFTSGTMKRGVIWGLCLAVGLCVLLGIGLGSVGSQLDEVRLERDDLTADVDALRIEVTTLQTDTERLTEARAALQEQIATHTTTVEALKVELEQARREPIGSPAPAGS